MILPIITEKDLKRHVDGLQLFPVNISLNQHSVLPLSSTSGYYVPTCNTSGVSCNSAHHYFLLLNHSSTNQIVFVKHYDHLTERLAYVGSIGVSQNEYRTLDFDKLIESICSDESLLPTIDPKQVQLIQISNGSSLSQPPGHFPVYPSLRAGSTVIIADKSVPLSKLQSFPAIGKVLEQPPRPKSEPLGAIYRKMLDNKESSDLVLKVEGRFIYVSSHILIPQSTYFRTALTGDFGEKLVKRQQDTSDLHQGRWPVYTLPDLTYDGVMFCLEWIYTREITMLEEAVRKTNMFSTSSAFTFYQQTYIASHYLAIEDLSTLLCPRLPRCLNDLNFGDAYEFSIKYGLTDLGEVAVQFMKSCAPIKKIVSGKEASKETPPVFVFENKSHRLVDREELVQKQFDKVFEVIQQSSKTFRMFVSAIV